MNDFRSMRRFKQQITQEECLAVLKAEKRGVLSLLGENGYPYGVPMNHWFCEEDGRLYFHAAKEGHKLDAIKACDKVCYTVVEKGAPVEGDWALKVKSVVVFGRMSLVTDEEQAVKICSAICRKFTDDEDYLRRELASALPRVQCLALTPEHMTGKLVTES